MGKLVVSWSLLLYTGRMLLCSNEAVVDRTLSSLFRNNIVCVPKLPVGESSSIYADHSKYD